MPGGKSGDDHKVWELGAVLRQGSVTPVDQAPMKLAGIADGSVEDESFETSSDEEASTGDTRDCWSFLYGERWSKTRCVEPTCIRRLHLSPMDEKTYEMVMAATGALRVASRREVGSMPNVFSEAEQKLRQDMMMQKVAWVGSFYEDMWLFLINNHPILALFYSHPLHPISRCNRLIVYIVSCSWILLVYMASWQGAVCLECTACTDCRLTGCHALNSTCPAQWMHKKSRQRALWESTHFLEFMGSFCCSADILGAVDLLRHFGPHLGGTIYSFVANSLLGFTCFQLMMCGCVQSSSRRGKCIGEFLGQLVFAALSFLCISLMWREWWGFNWSQKRLPAAVYIVVQVKLISWFGISVFQVAVFSLLWWIQTAKPAGSRFKWLDHPQEDRRLPDTRGPVARTVNPRFHVLYVDYREYVVVL